MGLALLMATLVDGSADWINRPTLVNHIVMNFVTPVCLWTCGVEYEKT